MFSTCNYRSTYMFHVVTAACASSCSTRMQNTYHMRIVFCVSCTLNLAIARSTTKNLCFLTDRGRNAREQMWCKSRRRGREKLSPRRFGRAKKSLAFVNLKRIVVWPRHYFGERFQFFFFIC